MIASALLLIPAAFALAAVVRDTSPRVARATTAMIVTGAVAMACLSTVGFFAVAPRPRPRRGRRGPSWDRFFSDETGDSSSSGCSSASSGFLALATSLYRSGLVPRAAAVLSGLGGAAILITPEARCGSCSWRPRRSASPGSGGSPARRPSSPRRSRGRPLPSPSDGRGWLRRRRPHLAGCGRRRMIRVEDRRPGRCRTGGSHYLDIAAVCSAAPTAPCC